MRITKKSALLRMFFLMVPLFAVAAPVPEKIISADAGVTTLLRSFGLEEQLVGIDVTSPQPVSGKLIPNVGYHRQLSAEGLLSLHPDVLIGSENMGPPEALAAVTAAGVSVVRLPSAEDGKSLLANVQQLAKVLGKQAQGEVVLAQLSEKFSQLDQQKMPNNTRALFLLDAGGRGLRAAGAGTGGDALIHLLGANNVMTHASYQPISAEAILAINPDVILVAIDAEQNPISSLLQQYPALSVLNAIKNARLLNVRSETLVAGLSVLTVDEALRLAAQ